MPRPPRLEFPGAVYHVTARGNERRAIFRDDRDREAYLAGLAHYRRKFGFRLLAYCLMTNHVHLAIRTGAAPLSRIMAGIQSRYAQRFNRRHARVGHLFQGRYKSSLVQEDRYLMAVIRYIHRNPVRAGLTRNASQYPWSSDRYLRTARGPTWLDIDETLSALGQSRRSAAVRYVALIDGPSENDLRTIAHAVVGDEAFVLSRFAAADEPEPPIRGLTEDRVLRAVALDTGLAVQDLVGPRRGGSVASARCLAAYLARRLGHISVRRMARRLGRDDSGFTRPLARLEARLGTDDFLRNQIDRLTQRLKSANQD